MSRLTRDGTAEPVSRDQILRHARGQANINFSYSADDEQDWQPYPVDPYSAICHDHTHIHTYIVTVGTYTCSHRRAPDALFGTLIWCCVSVQYDIILVLCIIDTLEYLQVAHYYYEYYIDIVAQYLNIIAVLYTPGVVHQRISGIAVLHIQHLALNSINCNSL